MWIGSYNKSSRLQNNFVVVYSFVIATYTNVTFLLVMQGKRPCKTNVKRRLNLSSPRNINTRFLNMLLHVSHRCSRRVFHCKLTHRFIANTKVQKHYSCNIQIYSYILNMAYTSDSWDYSEISITSSQFQLFCIIIEWYLFQPSCIDFSMLRGTLNVAPQKPYSRCMCATRSRDLLLS